MCAVLSAGVPPTRDARAVGAWRWRRALQPGKVAPLMNPQVTRLTPQANHRLLLDFSNGERQLFDLTKFI